MALGAGRGDVLRMVGMMGLRLLAIGVVAGLLISVGATRLIANQLWSVSPNDPLTIGIAIGVMAIVGVGACYVPARRAMRVDPMVALRYE